MKRIFLQCTTQVKRNAVKREVRHGVEHIVISSHTLPDNVVMNGGLYGKDEVDASVFTLNRTLAPVEHPQDSEGNFISANDPTAIHNYYAGAFNENVRRDGDRIAVDKVINVAEAGKSERGKRLLDRIEEIETNEDARPIHTSVGVFVSAEELEAPRVNSQEQEYTWVARNMTFDHDAILLDSVGAAQPSQGVGIAVNSDGQELEVQAHNMEPTANASGSSFSDVREAIQSALEIEPLIQSSEYLYIDEVYPDTVIFTVDGALYEVPYRLDAGRATLVGIPLPVERKVTYSPKTNQQEGDPMRQMMINALAAAGVQVNQEATDEDVLAKYNELLAAPSDLEVNQEAIADAVSAAVAPLKETLDALQTNNATAEQQKIDELAELVGNSEKFPGLDVDDAKALGFDALQKMAANCADSFGLPAFEANAQAPAGDTYSMPE